VTNLARLPTRADKQHIHAVVETPRGSRCKLAFDPKLKVFTLLKPLLAGLTYPYDWGFVPSTKAEDGEPLDVLIIHDAATYPGLVLRCKPMATASENRLTDHQAGARWRPARSIFGNVLNFCRSAIAALVRSP
jgi:inorganic pyrophosphatase